MTLHPVEKEENRLLIEKAQRVFQESNALTRQYIADMLRHFKQTLDHGKGREIREEFYESDGEDEITFTANSIEDLISQIENADNLFRRDIRSGYERQVGQRFDSTI